MEQAFAAQIAAFLNYASAERRFSAHTVDSYERALHKAEKCLKRETSLTSFSEVDEDAMRIILREFNFTLQDAERMAASSTAHDLYALSSFFKFLIKEGVMESNPVEAVAAPKVKRPLPRVLSNDEAQLLISACSTDKFGLRDRAAIELLYGAGLRVGELTALDLNQLDLPLKEVRVVGKGRKERCAPFGSCAQKALTDYLQVRHEFKPRPDCQAVFLNRFGRRISTRAIEQHLSALAVQCGITGQVTPHKLRHSFATEMLAGGADIRTVQELLGHSSLAATQIYTHVDLERLKQAYAQAHPRDHMED